MPPTCPHCGRDMQKNTAASSRNLTQWMCGCRGFVTYRNEHRWVPPLELRGKHA